MNPPDLIFSERDNWVYAAMQFICNQGVESFYSVYIDLHVLSRIVVVNAILCTSLLR